MHVTDSIATLEDIFGFFRICKPVLGFLSSRHQTSAGKSSRERISIIIEKERKKKTDKRDRATFPKMAMAFQQNEIFTSNSMCTCKTSM